MKDEYRIKSICVVCGKDFLGRYNIGKRAKTCTPRDHVCKKTKKDGKVVVCVEKCCRSQYRAGASAAAMDNAIDPRKVLDAAEFDRVIKATHRTMDPDGIAIRFLAYTGCRLAEVFLVLKEDLILSPGKKVSIVRIPTVKKRGQGRPRRSVHIENGTPFMKELEALVKKKKDQDPIFRVARRTLQRTIEYILDPIKPNRESLAHIFRHTRASQLVAAGAPLNYIRQQLGWGSLEMVKIYTHTGDDEIGRIFDRMP